MGAVVLLKDVVDAIDLPNSDIEDDWFRFRQSEFEEIAKGWLEAHDIPFR
jgi:hypothetical protein